MYKIRRANFTDVLLLCRCYGSQRNQPNHYETLCIENNSSAKEIRNAFLKLSKEFHPDIGTKGSHAEFVKVNEAYEILSKDHSRRQYDIELKYQSASLARDGQSYRYSDRRQDFYRPPVDWNSRTDQFEANYYGVKGVKRVSNLTIGIICVVVCLVVVSLELALFRRTLLKTQAGMKSRSLQAEQDYAEAKAGAHELSREEQIKILQHKFKAQDETKG